MQSKKIITGALILTAAGMATKIMGFFNRVYMSRTIGSEGMGLYQLIMPFYLLMWSITSSGFSVAVSKLSAEYGAKGKERDVSRILRAAIFLCVGLSIIVTFALYMFAEPLSIHILKDVRCIPAIRLLAFVIPFMSAGSCIRGYFLGRQQAAPPAISQVLEQAVRMTAIFGIAGFLVPKGLEYACLAAVFGVVMGEIISFIYVLLMYLRQKPSFKGENTSLSRSEAIKEVMDTASPTTLTRVVSSLLSTAENVLIPQRLMLFASTGALSSYGELTGMAMPLIQLPSAVIGSLAMSLMPAISGAWALKNRTSLKNASNAALRFTLIIGIGAAMLFMVFPKELCVAVYGDRSLHPLLFKLAFASPFLYLHITLSGILNGAGEQKFLFANGIISSIINIGAIYFLTPYIGLNGFIAGWTLSLFLTVRQSIKKLNDICGEDIGLSKSFLKPLMCAAAAGFAVKLFLDLFHAERMLFFAGMFLALFIYLLLLLLCKELNIAELKALASRKAPPRDKKPRHSREKSD
ncbi:MAG: polysaccharide biosynthesis protein [Firmicutes bacterium]|nr:polysaccharide biosynthesis protein [Bacillota bacterium]